MIVSIAQAVFATCLYYGSGSIQGGSVEDFFRERVTLGHVFLRVRWF